MTEPLLLIKTRVGNTLKLSEKVYIGFEEIGIDGCVGDEGQRDVTWMMEINARVEVVWRGKLLDDAEEIAGGFGCAGVSDHD